MMTRVPASCPHDRQDVKSIWFGEAMEVNFTTSPHSVLVCDPSIKAIKDLKVAW